MNDWHHELRTRLGGLRVRPEREADIVDELAQHLDDEVRRLMGGGIDVDPAEARAAALAELDAPGELARRLGEIEARPPLALPPPGTPARGRWLRAFVQDVRYSLRTLRRSPIFALTVIVTLALTIGPTTAILSVGNWLVWQPVPGVVNPDRLAEAQLGEMTSRGDMNIVSLSYANLNDVRAAGRTFTALAGIHESSVHLAGDSLAPADAGAGWVTAGAFEALGVPFVAGRSFLPEEDQEPSGQPVVIIGEAIARRAFGTPAEAIGKRLSLNGQPMTVVGVVAARFRGITNVRPLDVWYTGAAYGYVNHFTDTTRFTARGGGLFNSFVIRLAPGATVDAAQAELDVLVPALAGRYPTDNAKLQNVRAKLTPGLGTAATERFGSTVNVLLAIGGALLLLGCANVANILMLRAVRTERDRAIRMALGASRSRLVALQLTESATLAVTGAVAGVLLAIGLNQIIVSLLFPGLPADLDFGPPLDGRVLLMTLGVSLACGLFAGFIPAVVSRAVTRQIGVPTAGGRSVTATRWLRGALASTQLALSLALVTGSLLMVSTLYHLRAVDLGFDPSETSWHVIDPSRQGYTADRSRAYFNDLHQRLQGQPGLEAVSAAGLAPFSSSFRTRVQDPAGTDKPPVSVYANNIGAEYFDVLRIRLVRGRGFTPAESQAPETGDFPVIVDEALARRLFGEVDPIGQIIVIPAGGNRPATHAPIVGVAASVHWNDIVGDQPLFLYQPLRTLRGPSILLIRSRLPLTVVAREVQTAARLLDPTLPVRFSQPLTSLIDRRLMQQRVFSWILSLVGWVAFALAAVGLYGLLAQSVAERTREFGVRMALGSGRARIFALVLRQAAWIAGVGGLCGLALAAFGTRMIETQLYGVTRLDPLTYAAAAAALIIVVFTAALWPARSATRIQPVEALRAE